MSRRKLPIGIQTFREIREGLNGARPVAPNRP
jgi:hypothetical protein